MTFSTIADRLLKSMGYEPYRCCSEEEARKFAAEMPENSREYPVYYFTSDTTGEKSFEEFYVAGERLDLERFQALGVITGGTGRPMDEVETFLQQLANLLQQPGVTKVEIVQALKSFLPNFEHHETGKNLDQKM